MHVRHAFANVDARRRGDAVAELMPEPRVVREGNGWSELQLGRHPDLFFAVHRLDFADAIEDGTHGRANVLNLVAGEEVEIETERGDLHPLSYAETIVVPAAVGRYRLRRTRGTRLQSREGVRAMSRTVALDLGGTHVSAGRVDLDQARVDESVRIALPPNADRDELLDRIIGAAKEVAGHVDVVGVAAPGPFDYDNGVAWLGHKLERVVRRRPSVAARA